MAEMPQRRSHGYAKPRGEIGNGLVNGPEATPVIEKRGIVTVYTTLTSSGFSGDLTTLPRDESSSTSHTSSETSTAHNLLGAKKAVTEDSSSATPLPDAISLTSSLSSMDSGGLVVATTPLSTSTSSTPSSTSATATSTTASAASATTTSTTSSSSSSSDDAATKAGIALGVLGGLFVVLAFAYWLIVRRRKQIEEQQRREAADKEKFSGSDDDIPPPVSATATRAPRLSLRMTGLFTGFNASGQAAQEPTQQTNQIGMASTAPNLRAPGTSAWERPMTKDSSSDHNPFGNNAQILEEPTHATTPISEPSLHMTSPEQRGGLAPAPRASAMTAATATTGRVSAITMDSATVPPLVTSTLPHSAAPSTDVSPIESAFNVAVGQALTSSDTDSLSEDEVGLAATIDRQPSERRQSVRQSNVPAPLDLTLPPKLHAVPPSPAGTEFSLQEMEPGQSPIASTSAAAIAAAGGPANSTVHRVQLDFKPTLDDEMGLQAGQLVRLLHEYDDGWALCIRLDRSEQGVVPRTCLSTRPVKPRTPPAAIPPRGPPVNSQGRPRGPSVSSQRGPGPNYGPGAKPMGPVGQRGPGYMRPMGAGPRPQSPGGAGFRNQSPSGAGRKNSPPGPSNRQQEYRPNTNGAYYDPAASRPAPGQAY